MPEHQAKVDYCSDDMGVSKSLIETMAKPRNTEETEEYQDTKWWGASVLSQVSLRNTTMKKQLPPFHQVSRIGYVAL